ncbi:MAG: sulfite exporter TauE/SafE family protein [Trebonia sp.]
MSGPAGPALLFGAGIAAGIAGSAGGITSLISYPALLWAGLPALQASVANTVALVACWPGSAIASRPELAGRGAWLRRWSVAAAAGGAAGAVLLLSTPPGVFGRVVPFLVALGSLTLLLQPRLRSLAASDGGRVLLPCGVLALSVYNGYFGAGSGVMLLALMLMAVDANLAGANALKNMLLGPASITSAVLFACVSSVDWGAVIPLAAGLFAGAGIGPRIARRMPAAVLRWLVAGAGLALAAWLWAGPSM